MDDQQNRTIDFEEIPCPLCGSMRRVDFLRSKDISYGVPGEFQIVRCLDCRHLYTNPRPTAATVLNCYPADYGPHNVETSQQQTESVVAPIADVQKPDDVPSSRPWYLSPIVRKIPGIRSLYYWLTNDYSRFVPADLRPGSRALELGCATGAFLEELKIAGCEVEGIEPVTSAAEEAVQKGFQVHAGTLESANLPDESFDAAFAWMVIEHLLDPRETLTRLQRLLRTDGMLVLSVPNAGCWEPYVFGKYWFAHELPRHLHHFTPKRMSELLKECGYDRVNVIHQRNLLTVTRSVGIALSQYFPNSRSVQKIIEWSDGPTLWWQLALAPFAIGLAWLHQGGRLTVIARKREGISPSAGTSNVVQLKNERSELLGT